MLRKALVCAFFLLPSVLCAQDATTVVSNTTLVSSCRQLSATTIILGDDDDDGYTRFEFNTSDNWPGTISCDMVTGASARQCLVVGLSPSTTYFIRATTFDGSDSVDGLVQEVLGGFSLPSCSSDQVAPTVLVLSPVRSGVVGGVDRMKIRVYDKGGLLSSEPVQWSVDSGAWTAAAANTSYDCGVGCELYEFDLDTIGLGLGNGRHYLEIQATDAAGNVAALAWPFQIFNVGAHPGGNGTLLRRTYGSQLCVDCHDLETHSSQAVGTGKGNWAFGCTRCHTPHMTRNIYLARETLRSPSSGKVNVLFHRDDDGSSQDSYLGDHSQANNEPYNDGICEVCHTRTLHYRNDDSGGDHSHNAGGRCVICHWHEQGFKGRGAGQGHLTHVTEVYGPRMTCAAGDMGCHGAEPPPALSDGLDLSATTVCDTCHSPAGTYDGVDDPVIGAKANWPDGVYSGGALIAGKEKWCVGCHDEGASTVKGVTAPNVLGEENGDFTYGTGWGFYKTGHGLNAGEDYPASGGVTAGAGLGCGACHDFTTNHVDSLARTFDDGDSSTLDPSFYRAGNRLKLVAGLEPMQIPLPQNTTPINNADQFRLCYDCHDSGPFLNSSNGNTNLRSAGRNRHASHLQLNQIRYASDWNGINNSRITCIVCHNVHGSTRLAMIRDGKLTDREPGLRIWYNNDAIVRYRTWDTNPPSPEDLPLSASTGTIWAGGSSGNLCTHCHGNNNTLPVYRDPFQDVSQPPMLSWTGRPQFETDGVNPDSAPGASLLDFRVEYTDNNNDVPVAIELWIDINDNGDYGDPGEKLAMVEVDLADVTVYDGKRYKYSMTLDHPIDGDIRYRFFASDGEDATGPPTTDSLVSVTNNLPTLAWPTDEPDFADNGAHPNSAATGNSFEFRVDYFDANDDPPSMIELRIDSNNDGDTDDPGEKLVMNEVDAGDFSYVDGKRYRVTVLLGAAGSISYSCHASDAGASATGEPANEHWVSVTTGNIAPALFWAGDSAEYTSDGVAPDQGLAGTWFGRKFEFRVQYSDSNDNPPASIEVWIDLNDDLDYDDSGEKVVMVEEDSEDIHWVDGKLYTQTITPAFAGDGTLNYEFRATDGLSPAVGDPTTTQTLTLVYALNVAKSGGRDFDTIQAAINSTTTTPILVAAATYQEAVNFGNKNLTVESVDGSALTVIERQNDGDVVSMGSGCSSTLRGFAITRLAGTSGRGFYLLPSDGVIEDCLIHGHSNAIYSNGASPTISGCIIENNGTLGTTNGAGMYAGGSSWTTMRDTIVRNNLGDNGAALFFNTGTRGDFIDCTFDNNQSSTSGGALNLNHLTGISTFTRVTFDDNSAGLHGGAIYFNGTSATFDECSFHDNTAANAGGVAFINGAAPLAFTNTFFTENEALSGGVFYANTGATLDLINCSVAFNVASDTGGVFYCNSANITVRNPIIWGNLANSGNICYFNGGSLTISDGIVTQHGNDFIPNKTFTLEGYLSDDDPYFTGADDCHIGSLSAAINHANATYAPAIDFDGDPRPTGAADDCGGDEYLP